MTWNRGSLLSPYRVVDMTDQRCQLTGALLANLGADVVAVESPDGTAVAGPDGGSDPGAAERTRRALWRQCYMRGKRSVALDLDVGSDRDHLWRLIRGADVLLESAVPGSLARRGLGREHLAEVNPALVHVSITPFGSDGPKATWAATDLTVMASASPLALTGDADRPPVRTTVPQAFNLAAAAAAGAAVLALHERSRSGHGQHVDVAAQQVAALATQGALFAEAVGAPVPLRIGGGSAAGAMRLRNVYPAADGYVCITHSLGATIGPATARLMAWVHEAGFCDEAVRDKDWVDYALLVDRGEEPIEAWEAAKAAVAAFTSSRTKAELFAGALERRVVLAPVADLADVLENPQFEARQVFDTICLDTPDLPAGRQLRVPGTFAHFSRWARPDLTPAPLPGQHTSEVLAEPERRPDPRSSSPKSGGRATVQSDALDGLKVLDLTWSVAGPAFTRVLADHGADVIKIESQTKLDAARGFLPLHEGQPGIENSGLFDDMNAGKRSVALKISDARARPVLGDLVRWADVVVDSFSPRALPKLGLDEASVRSLNPGVVTLSTSLLGQNGPLANFAGYGNLAAALCGFYELTGWPDRPPAGPYGSYTDYTSTHLMLLCLLAALDHRRRTGEGQSVDLGQAEASLPFLAPALAEASLGGAPPTRQGNQDPWLCPHGVFPDRRGEWVAVVCQDDAHWPALGRLIGRDDLADDPQLSTAGGRLARRRELEEAVAAWTRGADGETVQSRCQGEGIAAHVVQLSRGCLADPQLAHRGHFVAMDHPDRTCIVESTRFRLSRTPGRPRGRAPFLGEHTLEVLTEVLGYDLDEIADLAAAEVLE